MKLRESNRNIHQCGDIILTRASEKILPTINMTGQSIATMKKSSFTHALLCLGPGYFVEATVNFKIEAFSYTDETRTSLNSETWKVIRYKNLSPEDQLTLYHFVSPHLGKKYSLRNQETKSFCSSFIAMVYNDLYPKLNLFKNPSITLPVMLENLPDNEIWEDVTENYQSNLIESPIISDDAIDVMTTLTNLQFETTKNVVSAWESHDSIAETAERINKYAENLGLPLNRVQQNNMNLENNDGHNNWTVNQYIKKKKKREKNKKK